MVTTVFTPFPYLETERLSLWQLEQADAQDVYALRSDARVNQYIDRKPATSIEDAEAFIDRINKGIDKGQWLFWAVADKQTNKFLGTVCLWNVDHETDKVELGYELIYDAQGQGYMFEAVPKLIDFAWQRMHARVLEAIIVEGNERSVRLIDKLGFTLEKKEGNIMHYMLHRPE
ncbi:MAG: GNAT family N-acetyltransferase [Bacteroidetes bacterium]|nr:GNAT family N-acetyltransferase [Bacteroidota bacterium]